MFCTVGLDYNVTASIFNVTFSAGATSSSFDIDIIDNRVHENNETFNISLRLLPNCVLLSLDIQLSAVKIVDDDGMYVR